VLTVTAKDIERFWAKVPNRPLVGCWVWRGARLKGYGLFWLAGASRRAHRVAWTICFGDPGLKHVLHKCDTPWCVRPSHLFLGSQTVNNQDMSSKGRNVNTKKTHCIHGHALNGTNLYITPTGKRQCRTCLKAARQRFLTKETA